MAPKHTK